MKQKTWYIFRHGETRVSKHGGMYTHKDAKLLPEATIPLEKLGIYLKDLPQGKYFVSPLYRCQQTIAIVSKHSKKTFTTDIRLAEYGFETPWKFLQRIQSFIQEVKNDKEEHIYVCTHGIVITTLIHLLTAKNVGIKQILSGIFKPTKPGVLVKIENTKIQSTSFR